MPLVETRELLAAAAADRTAVPALNVIHLESAEAIATAAWAYLVRDKAFEAQGHRMIGEALQATRRDGLRVRPTCSFVARYIEKNPDAADLA